MEKSQLVPDAMLSKKEQKYLLEIKAKFYMKFAIPLIEDFIEKHPSKDCKTAYREVFDKIYYIITEIKGPVDKVLQERKEKGEIKDEKQSSKSIAGECIFLKF